jgi:hypothetical protein
MRISVVDCSTTMSRINAFMHVEALALSLSALWCNGPRAQSIEPSGDVVLAIKLSSSAATPQLPPVHPSWYYTWSVTQVMDRTHGPYHEADNNISATYDLLTRVQTPVLLQNCRITIIVHKGIG